MSDGGLAIAKGTFADFKVIKTRKTAQLIIEVPIEGADAALAALGGVPRADREIWVAVARLQEDGTQAAPPEPEKRKHSLAQQAAIMCGDVGFQTFLEQRYTEQYKRSVDALGHNADAVAETVRAVCGVKSRRDFDQDEEAAARWQKLHGQYLVWANPQ